MKKNRVNELVDNQLKRKRTILSYFCIVVILTVLILSLVLAFINQNKPYYINYNEKGTVEYKVFLKENEFFQKDYLKENNQYIASLINNITADFNYVLEITENVEYKYSYKINAEVDVKEKGTSNSLYTFEEELIKEKTDTVYNGETIVLTESLNIDYNHYNDLIKKFISVYDLDDIESTLNVVMYVTAQGNCEEKTENADNESTISLSIPLTTKTMAIDISSDLIDASSFLACEEKSDLSILILFALLVTAGADLFVIYCLAKYVVSTRTAENIYEAELKKILNNYSSYIQKINNDFDLSGYQVLKVDTFTDMLEIRDTIQEPILMLENKTKNSTYFLIPSKTKILYSYGLKIDEIKRQLEEVNLANENDEK